MKKVYSPISLVEDKFNRWIFEGLEALSKSKGACLTFVIIACAIDYLSSFNVGRKTRKKDYLDFLQEYDWFTKKYKPRDIYESLRCGLVHNFTIYGGKFALTHNHPELHLETNRGRIILNFEDFYGDFKRLKKEYFEKVKCNKNGKLENFLRRFSKWGFLATDAETYHLIDF